MSRDSRRRGHQAGLVLLTLLAGCTYWKNELPVGATPVVAEDRPRTLRVTLADGTRLELRNASIERDTLTGLRGTSDTMRVAVSDIKQIERQATDPARAVLLGVLFVGMIAALLELSSGFDDLRW